MNKSIACVFPETLPDERLLFPLVQVFGQVVHMQAIENEPPEHGPETTCLDRYRQQGQLHTFTPAPLGEQRERFCALVQDMRRRGGEYTSQLSMLTLAGLNRRDHPESHRSILSSLLERSDIKEQNEAERLLWQSRLMIKLGEFYDLEQAHLHSALRAITQRQDSLLAELCEEEENPFVLPAAPQDDGQETGGILRHRLKAWTRLCFHGGSPAPGLLVTGHRTAMDLLQEVYEKRWRHSARPLASLEIPARASGQRACPDEPLGRRCPGLGALLGDIAAKGSSLRLTGETEQLLQTGLTEWSRCTATLLPPARAERAILDLFMFPETTAPQLFAESFGSGALYGTQKANEDSAGCVVGLLTPA